MCTSALLRDHVRSGKVTIGVNHTMLDFRQRRKKDLDLVIARPADQSETRSMTLRDMATKIAVELDAGEQDAFDALPEVEKKPVGSVMVALEAKACMTAHIKSLPRLYDELNSSQQTVHGVRFPRESGHPTCRLDEAAGRMSPWQSQEGSSPSSTRPRRPIE